MTDAERDVGVSLRTARLEDSDFLFELFLDARADEFSFLPIHGPQREFLLRMQFEGQQRGYGAQFPDASDSIILHCDRPVGRLWIARSAEEIRVLDLALLTKERGAGIGSTLLRQVFEEAAEKGKPVRLSVSRTNVRAFELYRRLGFEVACKSEVVVEMEYRPCSTTAVIAGS